MGTDGRHGLEDSGKGFRIRRLEPRDDPVVAALIRTVLAEFTCGTATGAWEAETAGLDALSRTYAPAGHEMWVVEDAAGEVRGCGGFAPLAGAPPERACCELQRMYFLPELRGRGAGRALLEHLLDRMRACGFRCCYLETTAGMERARRVYAAAGFAPADRLGATGHVGCELPLARPL